MRQKVANIVAAKLDAVILVSNASTGINTVLRNFWHYIWLWPAFWRILADISIDVSLSILKKTKKKNWQDMAPGIWTGALGRRCRGLTPYPFTFKSDELERRKSSANTLQNISTVITGSHFYCGSREWTKVLRFWRREFPIWSGQASESLAFPWRLPTDCFPVSLR